MKSFNPFSMGSSQSNGNGFNMNNFQKFVDVMNMKNLDPNELLAKMQSRNNENYSRKFKKYKGYRKFS